MRLVERSPLPEGFSPRRPARKAMAWLYRDEDRRLMACTAVPLEFRMLWGVLDREGMRASEVRALTWADLDLKRGMVKLDRNKPDEPRSWALDAGVHAAPVWWRQQRADVSEELASKGAPAAEESTEAQHVRARLSRRLGAQR